MTGEDVSIAIKTLSESIGMASSQIIPHYAHWYVWSSIGFMALGIFICAGAICGFKMLSKSDSTIPVGNFAFLVVGLLLGGIIFFCQIGDLLAPTGISIHQLILDIHGGGN